MCRRVVAGPGSAQKTALSSRYGLVSNEGKKVISGMACKRYPHCIFAQLALELRRHTLASIFLELRFMRYGRNANNMQIKTIANKIRKQRKNRKKRPGSIETRVFHSLVKEMQRRYTTYTLHFRSRPAMMNSHRCCCCIGAPESILQAL